MSIFKIGQSVKISGDAKNIANPIDTDVLGESAVILGRLEVSAYNQGDSVYVVGVKGHTYKGQGWVEHENPVLVSEKDLIIKEDEILFEIGSKTRIHGEVYTVKTPPLNNLYYGVVNDKGDYSVVAIGSFE